MTITVGEWTIKVTGDEGFNKEELQKHLEKGVKFYFKEVPPYDYWIFDFRIENFNFSSREVDPIKKYMELVAFNFNQEGISHDSISVNSK